MNDVFIIALFVLALIIFRPKNQRRQTFVQSFPPQWIGASYLIGGHESNRLEFGVTDAGVCRANCGASCVATAFVPNKMNSSDNVCVFYDKMSSYLKLPIMPTDTTDVTWVKRR